ncbi:hypothetical protein SPLA10_PHROGS00155 [Salmonella phage SPLA10]|nr:hypothetical protein SPLA10_PHROGS00155 [Salmonella phage SPLA10]
MFRTAYSTTAASSFYSKELNQSLILAAAEGILVNPNPEIPSLKALVDRGPRSKGIPPFEHPVCLEQSTGNIWVVDMRPYASRIVAQDGSLNLPTEGPVALLLLRAKLEMYWNQFSHGEMLFWGDLPVVVFSRWITNLLKNRMNLAPTDIEQTQVLAGYYYFNLFYAEADFGQRQVDSVIMRLNRVLGISIDKVRAVVTGLGYMSTLADLTKALKERVDNPAMRLLDEKYLYVVTMNSWFGSADAKALIAVALEFPPAFIAMVLSAGTNQYKKTIIGEAVEREKSRHRFGQFQSVVNGAVRSLK